MPSIQHSELNKIKYISKGSVSNFVFSIQRLKKQTDPKFNFPKHASKNKNLRKNLPAAGLRGGHGG